MTRGWEIIESFERNGFLVKINGRYVADENGNPAVYRPPLCLEADLEEWKKQLCASIERMSGVPCNPETV